MCNSNFGTKSSNETKNKLKEKMNFNIKRHIFYKINVVKDLWEVVSPEMHRVMVMVFNVTFNNISVALRWLVLLVEETRENHRPAASH